MSLRAAIGAAVNAKNLTCDTEQDHEQHAHRIIALGVVGSRTLRGRLGALLLRMRYGNAQNTRSSDRPVAGLGQLRAEVAAVFAAFLSSQPEVHRQWHVRRGDPLLQRFALAVVLEWQHGRCRECGGEGTVPMDPDRDNPRGWRRYCHTCKGIGATAINHGRRAAALGVTFRVYEKYWRQRFDRAHELLADCDPDVTRYLQRFLRGRNVSAQKSVRQRTEKQAQAPSRPVKEE